MSEFGATLTGIDGTYSGSRPITIEHRWMRSATEPVGTPGAWQGTAIPGATGANYVLTADDANAFVFREERASNNHGSTDWVSSSNYITVNFPRDNYNVVVEGDSLTASVLPGSMTYADQVGVDWNFATGGDQISVEMTIRQADVHATFDSTKINIICLFTGPNDPVPDGGAAYQTVEEYIEFIGQYCDYFRNGGWKVIICTHITTTQGPGRIALYRDSVDPEYRTWVGTRVDAVVDFALDPFVGLDATVNDPAWFSDGIHPNDVGQARMAVIFQDTLFSEFGVPPSGFYAGNSVSVISDRAVGPMGTVIFRDDGAGSTYFDEDGVLQHFTLDAPFHASYDKTISYPAAVRIDYTHEGVLRGLFVEPAVINRAGFTSITYYPGANMTQTTVEAPDGRLVGARYTEDAINDIHYFGANFGAPPGEVRTWSVYVLPATNVQFFFTSFSNSTSGNTHTINVTWDLIAKTITQELDIGGGGVLVDAGIEDLGGGLLRPWVAFEFPGGTGNAFNFHGPAPAGTYTPTVDGLPAAYMGSISRHVDVFGISVESGVGASGSYIGNYIGTEPSIGAVYFRDAEQFWISIPDGTSTVTYTFDDNSTQTVAATPGAHKVLPGAINRPRIKSISKA